MVGWKRCEDAEWTTKRRDGIAQYVTGKVGAVRHLVTRIMVNEPSRGQLVVQDGGALW